MPLPGIRANLLDLQFLLAQLRLSGNSPFNVLPAGTGTALDPFDRRTTQGVC